MPELPHSHGHSHGHSHEDGKKCNSHDHSTTVDTAPKASTSTGTCGHSHSHGHSHGHDHDSKDATNKEELDSSVCLAVVRENGSEVVLFDATGSPRVFSQEDVNKGSSKLCFSSHGVDGVDSMLTPCFDEEGRHGVPDEGCFCGVETPHLHAHVHDPKRCEQEDAAKETTCASKKKKNSNGEDDFSYLSKLTLHPTDEKSQSTGKEQLVSMGVSERLPKQCNSKDLKRELADRGMNDRGNGRHRRIHKVQVGYVIFFDVCLLLFLSNALF